MQINYHELLRKQVMTKYIRIAMVIHLFV